ncbi:MAG TPA: hypothetical protein VLJ58_06745 [Ramlibacter sp.]|nr:hypothetical protein [Ramlibacter sp.]
MTARPASTTNLTHRMGGVAVRAAAFTGTGSIASFASGKPQPWTLAHEDRIHPGAHDV